MEQFRHQNNSWASAATVASGSKSSNATYSSIFSNAFPLNLINKAKIRVDFDFTSTNENDEINKNSKAREIPIQREEEPVEDSDDDIPELISEKEAIAETKMHANNFFNEIVNINDAMAKNEVKFYPNDVSFPKIQINNIFTPQTANIVPNPFINKFVPAAVPVYDINHKNNFVQAAMAASAAISNSVANQVPVPNTAPNSPTKSYVIGYVSNDAAWSTPEDELFISNYMKQHSASEIQRALAACKKEYQASINKNDEIKHEEEEEEDDEQDEQEVVKNQPVSDLYPDVNNVSENPIKYTSDGHIETDISISSENFNEIFAGVPLVKLTNEACCHNGMTFVEGENVDHNQFRFDHSCGPDGIYFCRLEDMFHWLDYSSSPMYYMWDVVVPANARAVMYRNKLKANRLVLSNKRKISDYVTSKLMGMVVNNENIDEVFNFIGRLSSVTRPDAQSMEDIYLAMLARNFAFFNRIPEDSRTYNLSMFLAINDPNGYEKIKDECVSHEILMKCIMQNPDVYHQIPEDQRSQEMSDYLFSLDSENYTTIIDEHKTLQMTEKYLSETQYETPNEAVPYKFINEPSIAPVLVQKNGEVLCEIDFRLKDYNLCRSAVRNSGRALESVPLALVDQEICNDAVVQHPNAYKFVPLKFRTVELKEAMIKAHPHGVLFLSSEEITHNMILSVVSNAAQLLKEEDVFDFESKHITDLFTKHIEEYINAHPDFYMYVPSSLFSDEMALKMVTKNESAFLVFADRSTKFIVECVKIGLDFSNIPSHEVTQDMLNELVTKRYSVITELSTRFLSDDLFIICMRVHNMTLSEIPEGFKTSKLTKIALELYPAEAEIQIDQIENVEHEYDNGPSAIIYAERESDSTSGSIGFDNDEITVDDISTPQMELID